MRLGISSYTFTWAIGVSGHYPQKCLDVMELIDRSVELGVHVLQIADNLPLDRLSDSEIKSIINRSSESDIEIEVGTRGILNDNLLIYLDLAKRLNSKIVRVVIDTQKHQPSKDEVVQIIKPLMPQFEKSKIHLAIENHDRFPVNELKWIINKLDSKYAGICLDNANSFGAMECPNLVVGELGPLAINLHVKGFNIYRANHGMGFIIEGTPIDKSMLDFSWLLGKIRHFGRDVNVILEQWTPFENDINTTILKEADWARISIEYMRKFIKE